MIRLSYILFAIAVIGCETKSSIEVESDNNSNKDYFDQRNDLIQKDSTISFDASIVLSDKEQQVNEKLIQLRDSMNQAYEAAEYFPPAKDFFKSKDHIKGTKLFRLLKEMPKGGFLHMHASAVKDFYWLIDRVISLPEMYVYWEEDSEEYLKGQLRAYNEGEQPAGYQQVATLANSSKEFKGELYELLTLAQETDLDTVDIWKEFDKVFMRIGGAYAYQPIFEDFHRAMFESLVADNIQHVELRQIMFDGLYDLEHPAGYYNEDSIIQTFQRLELEMQETYPAFSIKLIYTDLRFRDKRAIQQSFANAYGLRSRYPTMVMGFDLVSEEDAGNPTLHYIDSWLKADSLQERYGVDMPFYFHDGESNWYSNKNLYDAIILGSRRIGHGINLNLFPALIEEVIARDICLEISPISNQVLGYVEDLRVHPANTLIRQGVQITISSDDPAIYQYEGLTPDYWSILLAWQLDLRSLKKLSMNGIIYSSLSDDEKAKALQYWESDWNDFVAFLDQEL